LTNRRCSFDNHAAPWSNEMMWESNVQVVELAAEIGERRGVTFQLGEFIRAEPGVLSDSIRQEMLEAAEALEIPFMELGSGASHDAQAFAVAGEQRRERARLLLSLGFGAATSSGAAAGPPPPPPPPPLAAAGIRLT
jgi:hypothetical protein